MGVPSGVPSGKTQRSKAPGVECIMSSGSGPARLEEKGTLKDRLMRASRPGGDPIPAAAAAAAAEDADGGRDCDCGGGGPTGLRMAGAAMSWCGRDIPKVGVMRSQPWRAWPVKLEILCMLKTDCERRPQAGGRGGGSGGGGEAKNGGDVDETGRNCQRGGGGGDLPALGLAQPGWTQNVTLRSGRAGSGSAAKKKRGGPHTLGLVKDDADNRRYPRPRLATSRSGSGRRTTSAGCC